MILSSPDHNGSFSRFSINLQVGYFCEYLPAKELRATAVVHAVRHTGDPTHICPVGVASEALVQEIAACVPRGRIFEAGHGAVMGGTHVAQINS